METSRAPCLIFWARFLRKAATHGTRVRGSSLFVSEGSASGELRRKVGPCKKLGQKKSPQNKMVGRTPSPARFAWKITSSKSPPVCNCLALVLQVLGICHCLPVCNCLATLLFAQALARVHFRTLYITGLGLSTACLLGTRIAMSCLAH